MLKDNLKTLRKNKGLSRTRRIDQRYEGLSAGGCAFSQDW